MSLVPGSLAITYHERRYNLSGYYTGTGSYSLVIETPHNNETAYPWRVLKRVLASIDLGAPRIYGLHPEPPVVRQDLRVHFVDGFGMMDIQVDTGATSFIYTIVQRNRFKGEIVYQNLAATVQSIKYRLSNV